MGKVKRSESIRNANNGVSYFLSLSLFPLVGLSSFSSSSIINVIIFECQFRDPAVRKVGPLELERFVEPSIPLSTIPQVSPSFVLSLSSSLSLLHKSPFTYAVLIRSTVRLGVSPAFPQRIVVRHPVSRVSDMRQRQNFV